MQPIASPSLDYVPGPEHPPSPDYVPGPEHSSSPVEVPYVPEPEYPEYLVPSDVEAPLDDQPLPANALPTSLSPGYMADFDPDEDPKEDPKEDHADYPADGGDGDDEPSDDDNDDDDTDDEDEEPFEDEDDDDEEDEVGESAPAAHRPTGGHKADYRFSGTYGCQILSMSRGKSAMIIRDVWEQDTQDIYATIEDTQDRQTQLSQRVDVLIEDRQFHHETALLLDQEALDSLTATLIAQISSLHGQLSAALGQIQALQARDQTHADDLKGAGSSA
ncbi:hypothetical protein Tco_0461310 [Tanacetum coccineum]